MAYGSSLDAEPGAWDPRRSPGWRRALDDDRSHTATATATEVAASLADPARLSIAVKRARQQSSHLGSLGWDASTLGSGPAGLAAMCAYLDACFPEQGWDATADGFLASAAKRVEQLRTPVPGLFDGVGGLACAASLLNRAGSRYQRLQAGLDSFLAGAAAELAERVRSASQGLPTAWFDVISGLSGLGAYLLRRSDEREDMTGRLRDVTAALVTLAKPGSGLPRWWTPRALIPDQATRSQFPLGNLNCGLAHGIAGPVAVLALALRAGIDMPGQERAVRALGSWLVDHCIDDEWGINWPSFAQAEPPTAAQNRQPSSPARSGWCYGSPGVARSLWIAGEALREPSFRDLAVEAMAAVYRRPPAMRRIDSPTFCHGVAGLLQVTLRFAHDTGMSIFTEAATGLADQLLAARQPDSVLGYTSVDAHGRRVESPGLLDGAAGVAVVLLAAATDIEPEWDRLFLLA